MAIAKTREIINGKEAVITSEQHLESTYNYNNQSIDVSIQDQTSPIIDFYLMQELEDLTLANTAVIDSYELTVTDASNFTVGEYVGIQEGVNNFQAQVQSIAVNTLTLDTPLDFAYSTSAQIKRKNRELAVNGSVTPVILRLGPTSGVAWDITRVVGSIVDNNNPDDTKFGGISGGITNGIVLRSKGDLSTNIIFNTKTNGELAERMFDVNYSDRAGGAGSYGVRFKRTFAGQDKNGVVIRLDGDNNDEFQMIVQDDLTSLSSFHIVVQGHIVE